MQGPLLPSDPHPYGEGGGLFCPSDVIEGSWLNNVLPPSCWPTSWEMPLAISESREMSDTPRIWILGQGRGRVMNPRDGRDGRDTSTAPWAGTIATLEQGSG